MHSVEAWGTTLPEVTREYACDRLLPDAPGRYLRAVDCRAEPAALMPWLRMLRVAPYSYDWIDNGGRRSPRTLAPQALQPGDRMMTIFTLVDIQEPNGPDDAGELTVRMRPGRPHQVFGDVAVTYRAVPGGMGSRLVAALRVTDPPGPVGGLRRRLLACGDVVMMRKQLRTLAALAESTAAAPG